MENELVLFETKDEQVKLNVKLSEDTVWLTQQQMLILFDRDQSVISRHINNVFRECEVEEKSNMHFLHIALPWQFPLTKNVVYMPGDNRLVALKQFRHLRLGQPDGVAFQSHLHRVGGVLVFVDDDLAHGRASPKA